MDQYFNSICNMCSAGCGLKVRVKDNKIYEIGPWHEHLYNTLCPKADTQAIIELIYSNERITQPLIRTDKGFTEVTWDNALNYIAEKLAKISQSHGAKALAYNTGNAFIRSHTEKMARRFCDVYGTPNYTGGGSFCFFSRRLGQGLTFNHSGVTAQPDWTGTKCTIVWGSNPEESDGRSMPYFDALRQRGGKLIVIDPRRTAIAARADIHARIRPGTDSALALGMMHVIIEENLIDQDFVSQWTVGFEALKEHVRQYSPEKVSEITWVPVDIIKTMARLYSQNKPANIMYGVAMEHCISGVQANRAIAILIALTGNLEIPGGNIWQPRAIKGTSVTNLRMKGEDFDDGGIGGEYPVFNKFCKERTAMAIPEAVLHDKPYPIKALIIHGTDPLAIWPNHGVTKEAFQNLELLVVMDLFMNETAELADVFLPAASFLEGKQLKDYTGTGPAKIAIGEQAIAPLGDSREDWRIIADMAKHLGYGEYFPWHNTEELFEYLLEPINVAPEVVKRSSSGITYAQWEPQKYLKEGFGTPSGKVEIYSNTLQSYGYSPLPTFVEPTESPFSKSDVSKKYPFILITGPKTRYYTHSRFRNVPSLRKKVPEPLLEINTEDALELNIVSGDWIFLESPRGRISIKASVTENIIPGVVCLQHGWVEANANKLTSDADLDPISGYPPFRTSLCRVKKA